MNNKTAGKKAQKSTLLLLLSVFLLFNAAHLFRTSINTLYFTEDTSGDYAVVEATVIDFKPDSTDRATLDSRIIPVFSFSYKGKEVTLAEPDFSFHKSKQK